VAATVDFAIAFVMLLILCPSSAVGRVGSLLAVPAIVFLIILVASSLACCCRR